MNFLLHRHFAALALSSPAAGAGAMLPDLWRMADRRVRARPGVAAEERGHLRFVLAGIEHHLDADARFHRAPAFVEGERALADALARGSFTAGRMRLFAHVLWELCLDGALLRRDGFERTLADVRAGFAAARDELARAADLHHFEHVARSDDERASFDARMRRMTAELERGPWIEGYASGEGIALRLSGVRTRVGLPALDAADTASLAALLDAAAGAANAALESLSNDPGYFQATSRAEKRLASRS